MKLLKKIAAGFLLTIGLPVVMLATIELFDPNQSPEEKEESLAVLFVIGMPFSSLGGWLVWGLHRQAQKQKEMQEKEKSDRLRSIFFQLLQEQEGQITVLRFAQAAQLSGEAAREYLDERAKEFNAGFNVSEEGAIFYYFQI